MRYVLDMRDSGSIDSSKIRTEHEFENILKLREERIKGTTWLRQYELMDSDIFLNSSTGNSFSVYPTFVGYFESINHAKVIKAKVQLNINIRLLKGYESRVCTPFAEKEKQKLKSHIKKLKKFLNKGQIICPEYFL